MDKTTKKCITRRTSDYTNGGNGEIAEGDLTPIVTTDRLKPEHLTELAEGRRLAIRIPGYCPKDVCDKISRKVDNDPRRSNYKNAPIGRVGMAYFETNARGGELRDSYFDGAVDRMAYIRSIFDKFESPLDRFCRELDERWPHGASTLRLADRKMNVGLLRDFEVGSEAEPHQDVLDWDAPNEAGPVGLELQFAYNVYLRTSQAGGELELWDTRYSFDEFELRRIKGSYGLERTLIPLPTAVLGPAVGELILFNASRVHAVRPAIGTSRITITCFVGYRGRDRSLVFWS